MVTISSITQPAEQLKHQLQSQGYWTTDDEAKRRVLNRIRWMSSELDRKWKVCGWWRVGYDSLLSIIPGGAFIAMGFSIYLYALAARFELPAWDRAVMLARILFDTLIGSIPIIGWFADSLYKANIRNMQTLEKTLITTLPPNDVAKLGIAVGPDGQPYDLLSEHDDGKKADEIIRRSWEEDNDLTNQRKVQ